MKKILWITNDWLYDFGGRKIASKKILNFLAEKKYKITVLDFEIKVKKPHNYHKLIGLDSKIKYLPLFIKKSKRIIFEQLRFASGKKFDFIICSSVPYIDLLTISTIKCFRLYPKSKLILFEHTNPQVSMQLAWPKFFYKSLAAIFYKKFDFIVTPATELSELFIEKYEVGSNNVRLIHYPVINRNVKKLIAARVKENFFIKKSGPIIITIARLNLQQKDFFTLIKAFQIVRRKMKVTLLILGVGQDKSTIEKFVLDLHLEKDVYFLGFKTNPFAYLSKSDVFVLSSHFEGAPLVLVEAMACKIPIIATDCEFGPREILEDGKNGSLIPIQDYQNMARTIIRLQRNRRIRQTYIMNGMSKAREYSEQKSLHLWYKFLRVIK